MNNDVKNACNVFIWSSVISKMFNADAKGQVGQVGQVTKSQTHLNGNIYFIHVKH